MSDEQYRELIESIKDVDRSIMHSCNYAACIIPDTAYNDDSKRILNRPNRGH